MRRLIDERQVGLDLDDAPPAALPVRPTDLQHAAQQGARNLDGRFRIKFTR